MSSKFREAIKVSTTKKTNNGGRTPQYYNNQMRECVKELATSASVAVRKALAESANCPAKVIKSMLETDADKGVLRAAIMNPNQSKKAIIEFVKSPRADQFDGDEKLVAFVNTIIAGEETGEQE